MSLLALPVELRQKIYKLVKDRETLKRLSACSRTLRHDLAPLLWGFMRVTWMPEDEAIMRNLVYTKEIIIDFTGSHAKSSEKFKRYIEHCGASLKKIMIVEYPLDGAGKSFRELKKLPNLEELKFWEFGRHKNPLLLTLENMEVMSQLPSLRRLEVRNEKFEPKPFKALCSEALVSLKVLKLTKSRLTDPGLTLLKNLKSLEILDLTQASITVVGFKRINGLPRLKSLKLYGCRRIKAIPVLDALPSLGKLNLTFTSITDASIPNLKALPSLKKLDISCCKSITVSGFESLSVLPSLEVLRCEYSVLSPEEMDMIKGKLKCLIQDEF